jgi:hypothetical protein
VANSCGRLERMSERRSFRSMPAVRTSMPALDPPAALSRPGGIVRRSSGARYDGTKPGSTPASGVDGRPAPPETCVTETGR